MGTIQGSFQQSLVEIGTVVSIEISSNGQKLLYFKPESAQI
jgi:hypothetical protein